MGALDDDAFLASKIEAVVARYRHLWTAEQEEAFREQMAYTLTTHPKASKLLERERAAHVDRSAAREKAGAVVTNKAPRGKAK